MWIGFDKAQFNSALFCFRLKKDKWKHYGLRVLPKRVNRLYKHFFVVCLRLKSWIYAFKTVCTVQKNVADPLKEILIRPIIQRVQLDFAKKGQHVLKERLATCSIPWGAVFQPAALTEWVAWILVCAKLPRTTSLSSTLLLNLLDPDWCQKLKNCNASMRGTVNDYYEFCLPKFFPHFFIASFSFSQTHSNNY